MAVANRPGRINYEPNSVEGEAGGPRESPERGFRSFPAEEAGERLRVRSETFADHYSQARQFFISQTPVERCHIAASYTFELSKVDNPRIRERIIGHLRNVHEDLARSVAAGLGLAELPDPMPAAVATNQKLAASPALSIARNPPGTFAGRKLGIVVADGAPGAIVTALAQAVRKAGGVVQVIAPAVGGVTADDGSMIAADGQLAGSPSVVFDAVALIVGDDGAPDLAALPATRDFIADAFAHCKYIGYTPGAEDLIATALGDADLDGAVIEMESAAAAKRFCAELGNLRAWDREKPNDTTTSASSKARPAAKRRAAPPKGGRATRGEAPARRVGLNRAEGRVVGLIFRRSTWLVQSRSQPRVNTSTLVEVGFERRLFGRRGHPSTIATSTQSVGTLFGTMPGIPTRFWIGCAPRPIPNFVRDSDAALRSSIGGVMVTAFAVQVAVLYAMETIEQVVVRGHPLGGTLWLGGPARSCHTRGDVRARRYRADAHRP